MSIVSKFKFQSASVMGALFLSIPGAAQAVCAANQVEIFSCAIGAKTVELCQTMDDHSVTYRFGPAAAPELELTRSYEALSVRPWNGIGRTIWDEVGIENNGFSYVVGWWFDKFDQTSGGNLSVWRGESVLAEMVCDEGGFAEFGPLIVKMQEEGFCRAETWDPLSKGPCDGWDE